MALLKSYWWCNLYIVYNLWRRIACKFTPPKFCSKQKKQTKSKKCWAALISHRVLLIISRPNSHPNLICLIHSDGIPKSYRWCNLDIDSDLWRRMKRVRVILYVWVRHWHIWQNVDTEGFCQTLNYDQWLFFIV